MITGKQRAELKKLANTLEEKIIIGKGGISDNLMVQIDQVLEKDELVKIKVLQNNLDDKDDLVAEIIEKTGAEFVSLMGGKITIYRQSSKKENRKIRL